MLAEAYGWTFDYIGSLAEREIQMALDHLIRKVEAKRDASAGVTRVEASDEEKEAFEKAQSEFMAQGADPEWRKRFDKGLG